MKKVYFVLIFLVLLVLAAILLARTMLRNIVPSLETPQIQESLNKNREKEADKITSYKNIVIENLTIPWDIAFLSSGDLLVSEREGNLLHVDNLRGIVTTIEIPEVSHKGEGGLLGVVPHPDFKNNNYLYLYLTSSTREDSVNSVIRYKYKDRVLLNREVIVENIPGALFHNGGRIKFGPDGYLYIATGDATDPSSAQNINSLAGKILRVDQGGDIPDSNPFNNPVYSYGHRNPQGLTWDNNGNMWSTEHGRSGVKSGLDEINKIVSGGNYGWPDSQGDNVLPDTIRPILHSGPDVTWAPGSAMYWDGSIFFGGLKGETLYEAVLNGDSVHELKEHYRKEFGRIRSIVLGPDDMFYMTTSNRDGRGDIRAGDDKIIRLSPLEFR